MTGGLRRDLNRLQIKLDEAPNLALVVDAHGHAWQKSAIGYWYRAFDGDGISSFQLAQNGEGMKFVLPPKQCTECQKQEAS